MTTISILWFGLSSLASIGIGYGLGVYIIKRSINQKEAQIQSLKDKLETESAQLSKLAEDKAEKIKDKARQEASDIRKTAVLLEESVLRRENDLTEQTKELENNRQELKGKAEKIKELYREVEDLKQQQLDKLTKIAGLSRDQAKAELLEKVEETSTEELLLQIERLEGIRRNHLEQKAKNIMVLAMQKYAQGQSAEFNTATVAIESEEVKGRIIGKEGRNIRALENATGVQVIIDDSPDSIVLSCFDPIRRHIAKLSLEALIEDGRIQPARIEEFVAKSRELVQQNIKEAGEAALYDTGITGIDSKLTYILGRLQFRTSYGQNVLMHSVEVAHLAGAIAAELGANVMIAKMGGLFHDIGKALDHEIEGTHVEIGRHLLSKYGIKEEVIKAMQSHHDEYPYETIESRIVQVADALSASRPGARRDSVDNYIKRLGELESITNNFYGVERSYAINAGREIRVFVKPYKINDIQAKKMARKIAIKIEEELKYPGEIKVTLIRETRIIDYAR
ncbi:ribonuclease Y [bacterium]|nr:ribonuclease Y [Candidatus Elulimicrobium humile]